MLTSTTRYQWSAHGKGTSDKAFGGGMLLLAGVSFLYYTLWTILLPFFVESSPVHGWFPAKEWAIRIPAFILVLGISTIGLVLGFSIAASNPSKALSRTNTKVYPNQ